jgi:spore coat polysaccharide biosynthesis predicted glycosyltransferase SpsG
VSRTVLVLCAGPGFGSGHAVRCASLAGRLSGDAEVIVATRTPDLVRRILATFRIRVPVVPSSMRPRELTRLAGTTYVIDRLDTPVQLVDALRRRGASVVTFDDRGAGARIADLVVNAIVGRWGARPGARLLEGPRYLVLSPAFHRAQRPAVGGDGVLIALGGLADPDTVRRIAEAVRRAGLKPRVAAGFRGGTRRPLAPLLVTADISVTNGGLSMYESMALGVPTIALPQGRLELRSVRRAARRRAVVACDAHGVRDAVARLAADADRRDRLRRNAMALVDGSGLDRVVRAIREVREGRH